MEEVMAALPRSGVLLFDQMVLVMVTLYPTADLIQLFPRDFTAMETSGLSIDDLAPHQRFFTWAYATTCIIIGASPDEGKSSSIQSHF